MIQDGWPLKLWLYTGMCIKTHHSPGKAFDAYKGNSLLEYSSTIKYYKTGYMLCFGVSLFPKPPLSTSIASYRNFLFLHFPAFLLTSTRKRAWACCRWARVGAGNSQWKKKLSSWFSTCMITEHWCKVISQEKKAFALWFWGAETKTWCFSVAGKYFCDVM